MELPNAVANRFNLRQEENPEADVPPERLLFERLFRMVHAESDVTGINFDSFLPYPKPGRLLLIQVRNKFLSQCIEVIVDRYLLRDRTIYVYHDNLIIRVDDYPNKVIPYNENNVDFGKLLQNRYQRELRSIRRITDRNTIVDNKFYQMDYAIMNCLGRDLKFDDDNLEGSTQQYRPGMMVWLKIIDGLWWPGVVLKGLSIGCTPYFVRKRVYATVVIGQRIIYVTDLKTLKPYVCEERDELVKSGLKMYQIAKNRGIKIISKTLEEYQMSLISFHDVNGLDINVILSFQISNSY